MSHYPIPSYAASIWITGDHLWLGFPPISEGEQGHSVPYPLTNRGLLLAIETLKHRRRGERMLGEAGSPSRYQVERELYHDPKYNIILAALARGKEASAAEAQEAGKFLEELGL